MLYTDKVNNRLTSELLRADEAVYTVANGYIEMRGCFEEGYPEGYETDRATYLYGDLGKTEVVDFQSVRLRLGDENFSLFEGTVTGYERSVDIQKGLSLRKLTWTSPKGHTVRIEIRRMASFEMQELLILDYQVTSVDYTGRVRIESDVALMDGAGELYQLENTHTEASMVMVTGYARKPDTRFTAIAAYNHPMTHFIENGCIRSAFEVSLTKGDKLILQKSCIFTDSHNHGHTEQVAHSYMKEALGQGVDTWFRAQKDYMTRFWRHSKVEIMGDTALEEAVNHSIYQVMISAGSGSYDREGVFVLDESATTSAGVKAARQGEMEKAIGYLEQSLADCRKNPGGSYMMMVYGFGGFSIGGDGLHLDPVCPEQWEGYCFRLQYRGSDLKILVERDLVITASKPVEVWIYGRKYLVKKALYLPIKSGRSSD